MKFNYKHYDSQEKVMARKRFLTLLKSKTVWGAVATAAAGLLAAPAIGLSEIVQAGGLVVAAIGVRDALPQR